MIMITAWVGVSLFFSRLRARPQLLKDHDGIFQIQLEEGSIEGVPDNELTIFYHHCMSHH